MTSKLKDWHEMLPLAQRIYASSPSGCCWHVLLDDGNLDSAEFCANYAAERDCAPCMALAPLALRSSETQLGKLAASPLKRASP